MKVYHFTTELEDGRYKGKTVKEVFDKHNDFIFKTIKKWAINGITDKTFDDEVLKAANIKNSIRDKQNYQEEYHQERDKEALKPIKKLKKDNKSLDEIFDEIDNERFDSSKFDLQESEMNIDESALVEMPNDEIF